MTEKYGSGRALVLGRGIPQPVPITLDPAAYAGALVYGEDGQLYRSNGSAWLLGIGPTGAQGPQGPQGTTGATGAQGPAGPQVYNTTTPNNVVPVLVLTPDGTRSETDIDVALAPRGNGSILDAVPDNGAVRGNKRGILSIDLQRSRTAANQVASGVNSTIVGGQNHIASGFASGLFAGFGNQVSTNEGFIGGGRANTIGGGSVGGHAIVGGIGNVITGLVQSFIGGGSGNQVSGGRSSILGGENNQASGGYSFIGGGDRNVASGLSSLVGGGKFNEASGDYSFIGGGDRNVASGQYSVIPGGVGADTRGLYGRLSFASGFFNFVGDAQYGLHVLRRATTDATQSGLSADGATPSSTNIPTLPNNSLYSFRIRVSCIQTGGTAGAVGDCKAWDVVGAIKRIGASFGTALLGTPIITVLGADANLGANNATGAIIAIAADTTLGGLVVNVTGQTNKTLRWVATVEITEVAY